MNLSFNPVRIPLKNKFFASLLEGLLGLKPLIKCYDQRPIVNGESQDGKPFLQHALNFFNVKTSVRNPSMLAQIPQSGPVIFVSNHPLGGLEGIAMTELLLNYRKDLLVLTNELLTRIPELSNIFVGVDVLSENAAQKNTAGMRKVYKHLSEGGSLLVYPAGVVSIINTKNWKIEDKPWKNFVGRMVKKYQATSMPFFVSGRNSKLFYIMSLIHRRLRTIMLPRQLANKKDFKLKLNVGHPIPYKDLATLENASAITHYLRVATDLLAIEKPAKAAQPQKPLAPIETSTKPDQVLADLAALNDCLLLEKYGFSIYCAEYHRLNSLMDEIACAREITFRAAGEGTGLDKDSDQFDAYYLHLFLWDNTKNRLVGGYRIGQTSKIVATHGVKALYSRSLYHYDEKYLQRIGESLEMGRSFISPEYQKHPRALDMLWRGIGAYVAKNPQYHTLFGCVSISDEHSELAKAFLSDSMMESFRANQEFLMDIRPVVPLKVKGKVWANESLSALSNIAAINKLLGRCDPGKSIPVLLRQYLALNGKFVCFSVNKGFNNSLDGLIIVDLRKTSKKYLKRYLGNQGSQNFLQKWEQNEVTA